MIVDPPEYTSNVADGERVGMTIDDNALAHIMGVLTDLYSDPELAVIREYSTNAYDAHVEAEVERPIEVTLPKYGEAFFRVRDFGYGLNAEDIREIYSRYGASTKRDSDDVVGMLGLGCKSALTYTDHFTVIGIKDGIRTEVTVSREEDGGAMTIVSEQDSDEPSGVEIIVPTKPYENFALKAAHFFPYWNEGTVLMDGEYPERIDGIWIADDLLLTTHAESNMIVMGNVPYPVPQGVVPFGKQNWCSQVVAFVDIGEVNFTPSREALQLTKVTKHTCQRIHERVIQERDPAFQRIIDRAPERWDAARIAHQAKVFGLKDTTYKGEVVPRQIRASKDDNRFHVVTRRKIQGRRNSSTEITIPTHPDYVWLVGHNGKTFSNYHRQKLTQWEGTVELPEATTEFILVDKIPESIIEWIDPTLIFNWEDVKKQKIKRETIARSDNRSTGAYEGYVCGVYQRVLLAQDIDTSRPIVYADKYSDQYASKVAAIIPDATFVTIGKNRFKKFVRDFPTAKPVYEVLTEAADKWFANLTEDDKVLIGMRSYPSLFKLLDKDRVNDPELRKAIELSHKERPKHSVSWDTYHPWISDIVNKFPKWVNPLDKYVLLNTTSAINSALKDNPEHVYLYINTVYEQEQKSNAI